MEHRIDRNQPTYSPAQALLLKKRLRQIGNCLQKREKIEETRPEKGRQVKSRWQELDRKDAAKKPTGLASVVSLVEQIQRQLDPLYGLLETIKLRLLLTFFDHCHTTLLFKHFVARKIKLYHT